MNNFPLIKILLLAFLFIFTSCSQEKRSSTNDETQNKFSFNEEKRKTYEINTLSFQVPENWKVRKIESAAELPDFIMSYDFYNLIDNELYGMIRVKVLKNINENTNIMLMKRSFEELSEANFTIDDRIKKEVFLKNNIITYKAHIKETNLPQEAHFIIFEKEKIKIVIFLITPIKKNIPKIYDENIYIFQNISEQLSE